MKKAATLVSLILAFFCFGVSGTGQVFENLSVTQCDSLVNENYFNPNFVILDVRTSGEYNPQHLEDAININFYDVDFSDQLDTLNKEKKYLIHCKSGSRSSQTLTLMEGLGFQEVYNMVGGILAWNAQFHPTTDAFAPRFMFVTDSIFSLDTIPLMTSDTLKITITNRGNSLLVFESVSTLVGTEFTSSFDLDKQLLGSEDYTFEIVYTPEDELVDSLIYFLESNVGLNRVEIARVGQDLSVSTTDQMSEKQWLPFPNPVKDRLFFPDQDLTNSRVEMTDQSGRILFEKDKGRHLTSVEVSYLPPGIYMIKHTDENRSRCFIFLKE